MNTSAYFEKHEWSTLEQGSLTYLFLMCWQCTMVGRQEQELRGTCLSSRIFVAHLPFRNSEVMMDTASSICKPRFQLETLSHKRRWMTPEELHQCWTQVAVHTCIATISTSPTKDVVDDTVGLLWEAANNNLNTERYYPHNEWHGDIDRDLDILRIVITVWWCPSCC